MSPTLLGKGWFVFSTSPLSFFILFKYYLFTVAIGNLFLRNMNFCRADGSYPPDITHVEPYATDVTLDWPHFGQIRVNYTIRLICIENITTNFSHD